jgi:hypothetical protein
MRLLFKGMPHADNNSTTIPKLPSTISKRYKRARSTAGHTEGHSPSKRASPSRTSPTEKLSTITLKFRFADASEEMPSVHRGFSPEVVAEVWPTEWPSMKLKEPKVRVVPRVDSGTDLSPSPQQVELKSTINHYSNDHTVTSTHESFNLSTFRTSDETRPVTAAEIRWFARKAAVKKPYLPYILPEENLASDLDREIHPWISSFRRHAVNRCQRYYGHKNVLDTGSAILDDDDFHDGPSDRPRGLLIRNFGLRPLNAAKEESEEDEIMEETVEEVDLERFSSWDIVAFMNTQGRMPH